MKKIILLLSCCLVSFIGMSVQAYSMDTVPLWEKLDSPDDCDILGAIHFKTKNKELFEACKNREIVDEEGGYFSVSYLKNCPASHPLKSKEKGCLSCDGLEDVVVMNKEDCNVCSNREIRTEEYEDYVDGKKATEYSYHCQLKQCPENAPLRGDGDCVTCDVGVWTDDPKEICDKCPNRQFIKEGRVVFEGTKDGNRWIKKTAHSGCYLKEEKYEYGESRPLFSMSLEEEVIIPPCEKGKLCPIYGKVISKPICHDISQYDCEHMQDFYPCDTKYDIETLPEICAKCPNRDYVEGRCVFRECPSGSIKKMDDDSYDLCVECNADYRDIEEVSKEECHKCPNRFWGREFYHADSKYACIHCNTDDGYITTEDECARCPSMVYYPEMKMCVQKGWIPKKEETGVIYLESKSKIKLDPIPLKDLETPKLPSPPADVALFDDEF